MRSMVRALAVFIISTVAVPLAMTATVLGAFLFLPLPATLPEPKAVLDSQPSQIYDIDGNLIGTFHKFDTNVPFRKEDVPMILKQAVISSEDRSFYKHGGVDLRGTVRAFWADYRNRKVVQGGSTITQQYVKRAYTGGQRNVFRKLKEAILASQIDRQFDKEEILYRYLSGAFLGNGAYGVEAASELYFRHPVTQMTASEAALLAGILPAPSAWEPLGNPTTAEARRREVLRLMHDQHYLTDAQYAEAVSQGIWLASSGPPPGPATLVYRPQKVKNEYPYFIDYVERFLQNRYGDRLYTGGLKIQTTLDQKVQRAAEANVAKQLAGTSAPLEMSLVSVEPPTGFVKALVGGRDFYAGSQVNLALGGCPLKSRYAGKVVDVTPTCWDHPDQTVGGGGLGRQPGSSFKPFVLATAFSEGITPSKVYSAPTVYRIPNCHDTKASNCLIHNAEGEGGGSSDIRHATWHSINTVYAQIVRDVGCKETGEMAKKLGITSAVYSPSVQTCSGTYALGVIDVSPLDMASAYGVFAAGGRRADPTPVLRVTDANDHVLLDLSKPKPRQVIPEVIADNVTDVLKGVIQSGTGTAADIGRPAAGKTGTAENFVNAWFVGYTPTLSTSVWMGYSNSQDPEHGAVLRNIKGYSRVYGGTIPAITWHDFMSAALKDVPVTDFNQPAPIRPVADELRRLARGGIDAGDQRTPAETPADCNGPCDQPLPPPSVESPATLPPPTTEPPVTTTTSPPLIRLPNG